MRDTLHVAADPSGPLVTQAMDTLESTIPGERRALAQREIHDVDVLAGHPQCHRLGQFVGPLATPCEPVDAVTIQAQAGDERCSPIENPEMYTIGHDIPDVGEVDIRRVGLDVPLIDLDGGDVIGQRGSTTERRGGEAQAHHQVRPTKCSRTDGAHIPPLIAAATDSTSEP